MPLSRRAMLLGGSALLAAGSAAADPAAETRAAAWLQDWDGHAPHRTATAGDEQGAAWLARETAAIAGAPTFEDFRLDSIDTDAAFVEIDGLRIPGEKLLDTPDTPDGRVMALATLDQALGGPGIGQGLIHITELPPTAVYSPDFVRLRRETSSHALVILTRGGAPGLAMLNAEAFRMPYGPPILLLPSTDRARVTQAARRGAALRVVLRSHRTPATARNLVLTFKGTNPDRPPVVVMTPRSSWFQSTAERGGGLVCWLETLRALKAAPPPACDVIFTANSGHELGHIGLDDFIARRPGWEKTAIWIHYGANIGAAGGRLALQSADTALRGLAFPRIKPDTMADTATVPFGETRDIHRAGGRYVTLVGSNPLFHLPQDRLPEAVDIPVIARIAGEMAQIVTEITR